MTEPDASLALEEARLMRALEASKLREKDPQNDPNAKKAPEKAILNGWRVKLVNLPTAPNAPVELFVSKKSFFQSAADGNPVNADVTIPFQGFGQLNEFIIKIPAQDGFEGKQKFNLNDGSFIKFEYTEQGLSIKQQKVAF